MWCHNASINTFNHHRNFHAAMKNTHCYVDSRKWYEMNDLLTICIIQFLRTILHLHGILKNRAYVA